MTMDPTVGEPSYAPLRFDRGPLPEAPDRSISASPPGLPGGWRRSRSVGSFFPATGDRAWPRLRAPGWAQLVESLAVRALRRALARIMGLLFRLAATVGAALLIGLGSAWYMMDVGSPLTVTAIGPWRTWTAAGRAEADPYTRAHFARLGWLTLSSAEVQTFTASVDSDGRALYADCEYDVAGAIPSAQWWSLAVYDPRGNVLAVPDGQHVISRASAVAGSGNRISVRLAADARPGNWLPTLGGSAMVLVLRLQGAAVAGGGRGDAALPVLPAISKVECR